MHTSTSSCKLPNIRTLFGPFWVTIYPLLSSRVAFSSLFQRSCLCSLIRFICLYTKFAVFFLPSFSPTSSFLLAVRTEGCLLQLITFSDTHSTHTHIHILGMTPLDEGSTRRRDLYLTAHDTHKRQIFIPLTGFEPAIPANEQPQFYHLRQRGYRDRRGFYVFISFIKRRCLFQKCVMISKC